MKATTGPARPGKAKPKAKGASGARKPRKPATPAGSPRQAGAAGEPASRLIDQRIRDLAGWRGETLARMRALILEADPDIAEEWKWGTPVWSHGGIVCTGEAYTKVVKLTFARGARTPDPSRLFNASLEGNTRRAIDLHEGEEVAPGAFQALVKAAVAENLAKVKQPARRKGPARLRTKGAEPARRPRGRRAPSPTTARS